MTFTIGAITLPVDPEKATNKFKLDTKKISLLKQLPFLLSLGPDIPVLKLSGIIGKTGFTADQLETSYLLPLKAMIVKPAAYPRVLGDDGMVASGNWAGIGWGGFGGLGAATISDSIVRVAKGKNSVQAIVGNGSYSRSGMQRGWTTDQDWSKNDFLSVWVYGLNTGSFNVELYDNSAVEEKVLADNFSGWKRWLIATSAITSVNLAKIRRFRIGRTTPGTTYFDRICVGVGQYIDGPGTRYDGLYLVVDFTWVESTKILEAFDYDLELWLEDDYY